MHLPTPAAGGLFRVSQRTADEHRAVSLVFTELGLFRERGGEMRLLEPHKLARNGPNNPLHAIAIVAAAVFGRPEAMGDLTPVRLSALVSSTVDLDFNEAGALWALGGPSTSAFSRTPQAFHTALLEAIGKLNLHRFFGRADGGEFHRSIVPAAYNERTGEIYADEMASWRADFRAMAPERQMLISTIIWLYRSGPDSIWLRRVPCSWTAGEALSYLRDAGCIELWLRLIATYPGW
jgi:hypothetical protein